MHVLQVQEVICYKPCAFTIRLCVAHKLWMHNYIQGGVCACADAWCKAFLHGRRTAGARAPRTREQGREGASELPYAAALCTPAHHGIGPEPSLQ